MSESRPLPTWLPSLGVALALAGIVFLSFVERWGMLNETPYPVGVDGYFYPVQLRSLLETGTLEYPAAPLAFWLMAPFAALTDPIVGAKLGAAFYGALVALPGYGVGARLGRCRGAGLVAAAMATTSAGSAFLTIEFVKNGIGLTVLLTAVWLLLRALESPTRARIAGAIVGGVLALLAHKMAIGMFAVLAVPAIVGAAVARGALRGRRLLHVIGAIAGVVVLLAVLGTIFPRRLLSPNDLDLAAALFADAAHWDAPALVTPNVTLVFGHEALVGAIIGIAAAVVSTTAVRAALAQAASYLPVASCDAAKPKPGDAAIAWAVIALAIGIAWPWLDVTDVQGLGFRLRAAAFVPMSLAAAIVAGRVLERVRRKDVVLAAIAFALLARTPGHRDEGRIDAHPAMVAAIHALTNEVPKPDTVIVPERHIVFMVAWYARANVRIRPEQVPAEHRWRLVPLAWIGMGSPLDEAITRARDQVGLHAPLGLHPRHPNGIVLLAEPTWQWVLDSLPANVRAHWARWRTI